MTGKDSVARISLKNCGKHYFSEAEKEEATAGEAMALRLNTPILSLED